MGVVSTSTEFKRVGLDEGREGEACHGALGRAMASCSKHWPGEACCSQLWLAMASYSERWPAVACCSQLWSAMASYAWLWPVAGWLRRAAACCRQVTARGCKWPRARLVLDGRGSWQRSSGGAVRGSHAEGKAKRGLPARCITRHEGRFQVQMAIGRAKGGSLGSRDSPTVVMWLS